MSGEGVRIGEDVRVVVVEVKDNRVKLGIEAPRDLPIHRDEVYMKIQEENIRAASAKKGVLEDIAALWKKK